MTRAYPARPLVGIGIAVLRADAVLLVRRARAPAQGQWALPGGAQELGETAEAAARRELAEETAITVGPLHLAAIIDSIHHDAAGAIQYHYTIIDYAALWTAGEPTPGTDATEALFAPLTSLDHLSLSPQTHQVITRARALLGRE